MSQNDKLCLYFRFLYFNVATLIRLVRSGNTTIVELLRNIDLIQQMWFCLFDLSLSSELQIFDQQINTSMRRTAPRNMFQSRQNLIRFQKKILLLSLIPGVGNFVAKYTAPRSYKLFKTVCFKQ